jgi:sulfur carrier protein ThiS
MLLAPVPWRHQLGEDPLGLAWRLDGRLSVEGQVVDPPGRWSWLTVGRPPLVVEVLVDLVTPGGSDSQDLRDEPIGYDPGTIEATAAAVGLRAAGRNLEIGLRIEVADPVDASFPATGVVVAVNGVPVPDRAAWEQVALPSAGPTSFELDDGSVHTFEGPALPYETVRVVDVPPDGLDAMLFAWLPDIGIVRWVRSLALGPSHGLMVALLTYVHATGDDLAQGRHIAGTGGIRSDGTVTPIGGLRAKAAAAKRSGADVLLYPASQAPILAGFAAGDLRLVPVATLSDAIEALTLLEELEPGLPPERSDEVGVEEVDPQLQDAITGAGSDGSTAGDADASAGDGDSVASADDE